MEASEAVSSDEREETAQHTSSARGVGRGMDTAEPCCVEPGKRRGWGLDCGEGPGPAQVDDTICRVVLLWVWATGSGRPAGWEVLVYVSPDPHCASGYRQPALLEHRLERFEARAVVWRGMSC